MAGDGINVIGFCSSCEEESQDKSPGDIKTMNGVGRKFYGSVRP